MVSVPTLQSAVAGSNLQHAFSHSSNNYALPTLISSWIIHDHEYTPSSVIVVTHIKTYYYIDKANQLVYGFIIHTTNITCHNINKYTYNVPLAY